MATNTVERTTDGAHATEALAAELAPRLRAGDRLLLRGDLGGGKTTFVRGLVRALGGDAREVASPTFALHHRYPCGAFNVDHVDLYRLAPPVDLTRLGLDVVLEDPAAVLCCEWPERLGSVPSGVVLELTFIVTGPERRRVILSAPPGSSARLLPGGGS